MGSHAFSDEGDDADELGGASPDDNASGEQAVILAIRKQAQLSSLVQPTTHCNSFQFSSCHSLDATTLSTPREHAVILAFRRQAQLNSADSTA